MENRGFTGKLPLFMDRLKGFDNIDVRAGLQHCMVNGGLRSGPI